MAVVAWSRAKVLYSFSWEGLAPSWAGHWEMEMISTGKRDRSQVESTDLIGLSYICCCWSQLHSFAHIDVGKRMSTVDRPKK